MSDLRGRKSAVAAGLLFAVLCCSSQTVLAAQAPRIAIIIDDLGYQLAAGKRTVNLPGPVACAVLPRTPLAAELAEAAFARGKDVLLHLPLQSMRDADGSEPGAIMLDMDRVEFARSFAASFASVPHAVGVSNHRGSLLTQHPGHMSWLMDEIKAEGNLFFVDSYTTHRSIALALARESGVPSVKRDVFLDPDRAPETLQREFDRLKKLSRVHGMAVGIGHPYPSTLEFLERELPKLRSQGYELVGISQYIGHYMAQHANPREAADSVGGEGVHVVSE
ncbi:MAG TPA: divergent polysaccharide deacetylase family protein [Woeseiaceae bacterium]|nr:divergent polysaccharide deacetylase family protein [Woeseiaceae bacterium]